MTPEQAREAARALLQARDEHVTIEAIPEAVRPRTVDEGYLVQDALVAGSGAGGVRILQSRSSSSSPRSGRGR